MERALPRWPKQILTGPKHWPKGSIATSCDSWPSFSCLEVCSNRKHQRPLARMWQPRDHERTRWLLESVKRRGCGVAHAPGDTRCRRCFEATTTTYAGTVCLVHDRSEILNPAAAG